MKLILASSSLSRLKILNKFGIFPEKVIKPQINEEAIYKKYKNNPFLFVTKSAQAKAESVAYKIRNFKGYTILACDTITVIDNINNSGSSKILGKPKDKDQAYRMLTALSATEHKVITGYCILTEFKKIIKAEETIVKLKKLTKEEILEYINTDEPYTASGAIDIERTGKRFVESIKGDYYNICGLPISLVRELYCGLSATQNSIQV